MAKIRPTTGIKAPKAAVYGVGVIQGVIVPAKEITGSGALTAVRARASSIGTAVPTDLYIPNLTFTEGTAGSVDLNQYAIETGLSWEINSGSIAGITVSTDGTLAYDGRVPAEDGLMSVKASASLDDWTSRSTGAGVVWAHRFNDDSAMYWGTRYDGSGGFYYKDDVITPPTGESYTWRNPNDGILGDGCLELFCPAGVIPNCVWGRPLAPVIAEQATGLLSHLYYPADPAANGSIYKVSFQQFFSMDPGQHSKLGAFRGGNFGNATYRAEWGDGERIWSEFNKTPTATLWFREHPEWVHSGRFWLQFRMKLSASKVRGTERASKLMWPMERSMSGTDMAAVVMGVNAGGGGVTPDPTYTKGWNRGPYFYRAQGAAGLEQDMDPTYDTRLVHLDFPQCVRHPTFGTLPDDPTAVCWSYPTWDTDPPVEEWFTIMFSFDLGTDNPENKINPAWLTDPTKNKYSGWDHVTYPPSEDTLVQIYVAQRGDTQWTKLIDTNTWWWFGGDIETPIKQAYGSRWPISDYNNPTDGGRVPRGMNVMRFTLFNGGSINRPVIYDQWTRIDQIIFSTQPIALPKD